MLSKEHVLTCKVVHLLKNTKNCYKTVHIRFFTNICSLKKWKWAHVSFVNPQVTLNLYFSWSARSGHCFPCNVFDCAFKMCMLRLDGQIHSLSLNIRFCAQRQKEGHEGRKHDTVFTHPLSISTYIWWNVWGKSCSFRRLCSGTSEKPRWTWALIHRTPPAVQTQTTTRLRRNRKWAERGWNRI